jgi:hypothetical protein
MKSPLKPVHNRLAASVIKNKIGQRNIVDSFFFFDGNYECMLAANSNFVIGHTNSYVVEEFWSSLAEQREWIEGVGADLIKVLNRPMYELLQETWHKEDTLFIRSSLFFLLSRCSAKGLPSSGEFKKDGYSSLALRYLQQLSLENMHFTYHEDTELVDSIVPTRSNSIIFINAGRYHYGLMQGGANHGIEESVIDHKRLSHKLQGLKNRWMVNYEYSKPLLSQYRDYSTLLIDEHGNTTSNHDMAREVIIANF